MKTRKDTLRKGKFAKFFCGEWGQWNSESLVESCVERAVATKLSPRGAHYARSLTLFLSTWSSNFLHQCVRSIFTRRRVFETSLLVLPQSRIHSRKYSRASWKIVGHRKHFYKVIIKLPPSAASSTVLHLCATFSMRRVSRWQISAFANQTKILINRGNEIQRKRGIGREREGERRMGFYAKYIAMTWCCVALHHVVHCEYVVLRAPWSVVQQMEQSRCRINSTMIYSYNVYFPVIFYLL